MDNNLKTGAGQIPNGKAMAIEITEVGPDRYRDFLRPIHTNFGIASDLERSERFFRLPELTRRIAAFDGSEMVGSAGSFHFEMTTPGGFVKTGGLTVVGVLPTHRRNGILTKMMRKHLENVCADGQAISALWASEAPIYGRYGYGLASFCGSVNIERDRSSFAAPIERKGRARLLNEDAAASRLPAIWDCARRSTPGMLARSETWWRLRRLSDPGWVRKGRGDLQRAVLEIDGRDEAYALYRLAFDLHNGIIASPVEVIEAIGTTAESTALIWKYLFELDVVKTIRASLLPVDHPLFLLLAEPRRMGFTISDALWLRIADVAAALAARTYAREDAIVFDLEDRFCPSNSGRYRLDGGTRRTERTSESPDLRLTVEALGSAYLGGISFTRLALAGSVVELQNGALDRADALFHSPREPWCPEIF